METGESLLNHRSRIARATLYSREFPSEQAEQQNDEMHGSIHDESLDSVTPSGWFEPFYDLRMVRPLARPELQAALLGDFSELVRRVSRVLPAGSGQSNRVFLLVARTIESDAGDHQYGCIRRFFRFLYARATEP